MKRLINFSLLEHQKLITKISSKLINDIDLASRYFVKTLKNKKTIFFAGNGGSAADSQHIAAELVGRFKKNRKPLKGCRPLKFGILICVVCSA